MEAELCEKCHIKVYKKVAVGCINTDFLKIYQRETRVHKVQRMIADIKRLPEEKQAIAGSFIGWLVEI